MSLAKLLCSIVMPQQSVYSCVVLLVVAPNTCDPALAPLVQDFMAAAVVLEHMVRREYLKPYWRLWCYPTPSPEDTGERHLVWLLCKSCSSAP